jgi:glutathione peroxidase
MPSELRNIAIRRIDGKETTLADYANKVLLIVNVASQCGKTPQYDGLEKLHSTYRDRGFAVLGFPANNFDAQEPGTNEEIQEFCRSVYGVDFPMFAKISVKGADRHPLYGGLVAAQPARTHNAFSQHKGNAANKDVDVRWNFEKFLVDRSGKVVARFDPDVVPEDEIIVRAIETELGA